ncbi:MAG: transferrin-binding protein-like solute binding protein [Defluviicoccus sp.]|nr:transferrin-binding protein-like solute binding protein [Defluviicoccus sp.]MDE0387055.1 transferrin-binding protein-like solute binding protein [Defluviicoccus sp.]
MRENLLRAWFVAVSVTALAGLSACGNGTDEDAVSSHTIQVPMGIGPSASGIRDENGALTAIEVGETQAVLTEHRVVDITFGGERVGTLLHNEEVLVRHIDSYRNMQAGGVAEFEHMSYGVWATGTVAVRDDGSLDFNRESVGDAYLTALDDARTPAAEMPMTGTATYLGEYIGYLQGHGVGGRIIPTSGGADMTADFANAEMTVDLAPDRPFRLVLTGTIQGNEFSGTTLVQYNSSLLQAQGATAHFSGGFYGGEAVEAGGVFEVVGGRAQDPGRLVGAFGGRKEQ